MDPAQAVLDLKVLDPAMGSGHFLVSAVDFLTDDIADLIEFAPAVRRLAGPATTPTTHPCWTAWPPFGPTSCNAPRSPAGW